MSASHADAGPCLLVDCPALTDPADSPLAYHECEFGDSGASCIVYDPAGLVGFDFNTGDVCDDDPSAPEWLARHAAWEGEAPTTVPCAHVALCHPCAAHHSLQVRPIEPN